MFEKHFNLVLVLTLLVWMAYSLPSMKDTLASSAVYDGVTNAAAVVGTQNISGGTMKSPDSIRPIVRKELNAQEVVTLLYSKGIIPKEKLDLARKLVAETVYNNIPSRGGIGVATTTATSTKERLRPGIVPPRLLGDKQSLIPEDKRPAAPVPSTLVPTSESQ